MRRARLNNKMKNGRRRNGTQRDGGGGEEGRDFFNSDIPGYVSAERGGRKRNKKARDTRVGSNSRRIAVAAP